MMRKFASWAVSGLMLISLAHTLPLPAEARATRGGVAVSPNGCNLAFSDNGCAASPSGSFQVANFFTGYTGTTYPSRPSQNMAGVDYKVGMPAVSNASWSGTVNGMTLTGSCGLSTAQDPKTATTSPSSDNPGCGILPQHCKYGETVNGALTLSAVECSNTSNDIVFRGFQMGPVGGHSGSRLNYCTSGCTTGISQGALTGKITVAFNNWDADPSLYLSSSMLFTSPGLPGNVVVYANNMFGHWKDTYSAAGVGTATLDASGVLTVSACTTCAFYPGQNANLDDGGLTGNGFLITQQLTGTTGGVGTYQTNLALVRTSRPVTSAFYMGGGQVNTTGSLQFLYNAITQFNGRITTAQMRLSGGTNTVPLVENSYNYVESGLYKIACTASNAACIHWEMTEWVLASGGAANSMTFSSVVGHGNTFYQSSDVIGASTTAAFFINTGAVGGTTDPAYTLTYTNTDISGNVMVVDPSVGGTAALIVNGGSYSTNFTANNNWVAKGAISQFAQCQGVPVLGPVVAAPLLQANFTGSDDGSGALTLSNNPSQTISVGYHVYETKAYITVLGGSPPGQTSGVYTEAPGVALSSRAMRAAPDAITNILSVTGNTDLSAGTSLTLNQFLGHATLGAANACMFPGFQ